MNQRDFKVINLLGDTERLKVFGSYGFNLEKDIKKLKLNDYFEDITYQIIIELRRYYPAITELSGISVKKLRVDNPKIPKGKSSGFRIMCLIYEKERIAIPFHIFPKTGSERQDNITTVQLNSVKKMVKEAAEEREKK